MSRFINRLNLGEDDDIPWGEYRALCKVASAALRLCNNGTEYDGGVHQFDADDVKALNDALDVLDAFDEESAALKARTSRGGG